MNEIDAMADSVPSEQHPGDSLLPTDRDYGRLLAFLYEEAAALDSRDFSRWLTLLAEDIEYVVPVRTTSDPSAHSEFSDAQSYARDDMAALVLRVDRLSTDFAWAEQPPTRTRRIVGNARVSRIEDSRNEYLIRSNVLIFRNRGSQSSADILSAERIDRVRETEEGLLLARREVLLDQAVLGPPNLSIFL